MFDGNRRVGSTCIDGIWIGNIGSLVLRSALLIVTDWIPVWVFILWKARPMLTFIQPTAGWTDKQRDDCFLLSS